MPPDATTQHPSDQPHNGESNGTRQWKKSDEVIQKLKDLDDISYASSLSSTPILKLKSPKANNKSNNNKTTPLPTKKSKTPVKKAKHQTDKTKITKTSAATNNTKKGKTKKKSVNGKISSSDGKSNKSKFALTSIPETKTANHTDKQTNNNNGQEHKSSLQTKSTKSKEHVENGSESSTTTTTTTTTTRNQVATSTTAKTTLTKSENNNATTTTTTTGKKSSDDEHNKGNPAKKKKSKETIKATTTNDANGSDEEEEEEEAACYLCHCGVDCSDRALFFPKDRKKEIQESRDDDQEYYFGMDDPYLPQEMYDAHNALVYCDSCDRMYHQKCHFVPILKLPQGDWNCLICAIQQQQQQQQQQANHSKAAPPPICLPVQHDPKTFFASPPNPSFAQAERQFEFDSKTEKAKLWQKQLKSVKTFLSSQVSNIRLATAALDTLTSTKRNRAMILSNRRKSQELAQTLLRVTTAKYKIRQTLQSLESLRVSPCTNSLDPTMIQNWCQRHPKSACHVVPHGIDYFLNHRRVTPRTAEMKLDQERKKKETKEATASSKEEENEIPTEILCSPNNKTKDSSVGISNSGDGEKNSNSTFSKMEETKASTSNTNNDDDDDSGVTLDDLQCCICMVGDSTDDNDVILCDGQGCYRAFHMKCIHPEIKPQDLENEDEDWFCPLCTATSTYTHGIYDALRDGGGEEDDSDDDDEEEEEENKDDEDDEWDTPDDAFPNSQWEYEAAVKFSQGKQNEDTNELLALYLGDDVVGTNNVTNTIGSDSEDENDYSLFDEDSFAERKKNEGDEEEDEDDDSDRSSQATWLSSSVEMNIGKDELNALSEGENNSDSDDSSSESGSNTRRRSRRLRATDNADPILQIGVDFDEGNIVEGKRRRKAVDYRKLNDTLFGKLTEKQKAAIDDGADYKTKKRTKRKSEGENGNKKKKRAKSTKKVADSSSDEKNGEDTTATKQSDSPSKDGSEEASGSNGISRDETDRNKDDSENGNASGSENDSGSDGDSGDANDSNSEEDSGSDSDSDSNNGSDSEDNDE